MDIPLLLWKMYRMGIRGSAYDWIRSFLLHRSFQVNVGQQKSKMFSVNCGVPQGSILGPLLFLLFINDLPKWLRSVCPDIFVIMYADDTSVLVSAKDLDSLENKTNLVCKAFFDWCVMNKLVLNTSKSVSILFTTRAIHKPLSININTSPLATVSSTKLLGLIVDNSFKFSHHIDSVVKKINSAYHLLRKLKLFNSTNALLMIYYGWVYPFLVNHILVWGPRPEVQRLFILQKRIVRLIFNISPRQSAKPVFIKHSILTIYSILIYEACKFVINYPDRFSSHKDMHSFNTRNKLDLCPVACRTSLFKSSPINLSISCYNNLPKQIKEIQDTKSFFKNLKMFLLSNAYYSIKEYLNG